MTRNFILRGTGKYIPDNFNVNYVKSVEVAIENLESEFDKL